MGNQGSDNTLELLAVLHLEQLPIEREDPVKFALALSDIITKMTQVNEEKPKNHYFS